jgi:hypothetical protein
VTAPRPASGAVQTGYGILADHVPGPDGRNWVQLVLNFQVNGYAFAAGVLIVPPEQGLPIGMAIEKELREKCNEAIRLNSGIAVPRQSGLIIPGVNGHQPPSGPPPGHPG